MSQLTIEFAGEIHTVSDALTFGRAGDLCIDQNDYMHRFVGEFTRDGDLWWLRNRGSRIPLTLISADGKRVELPAGGVQALTDGRGIVRFQAGPTTYELSYEGAGAGLDGAASAPSEEFESTLHLDFALTPREVDYLACFCGPHFGRSANRSIPTYSEVAKIWGVSVKTLDNALQHLRRKIRDAGIPGVDSVESLVTFAVAHGLIGQSDLDWAAVGLPDGPRSASDGPRFSRRPS